MPKDNTPPEYLGFRLGHGSPFSLNNISEGIFHCIVIPKLEVKLI